MKVAQFAEVGVPHEVIECVEVDDPGPPAADEVVVEVIACPINPADLLIMEGRYAAIPPLPAVPGAEFVGQVLEIGAEVDGLAPGQRVITVVRENWVQKRKVKAAELIPVPQGVDTLQLAMLKANPATAYLMMKKYVDLAPGDWLIQDAANSGVGHCLIALAQAEGIRTVNVVRREGLEEQLLAAGGDVVVVDGPDLSERVAEATGGAAIRLAIDAVGGEAVVRLGDCLAEQAIILNYGLLSGEDPRLSAHQAVFKRLWLTGFWLAPWLTDLGRDELVAMYQMLAGHIADGSLAVPIEATYPIEEIKAAVEHAGRGHRDGKILLTPNGPVD